MDNANNIFSKMDLQQICSFLLSGTEKFNAENHTYTERLRNGSNSIYRRFENLYQDECELDEAVADLSEALTTYEEVYIEIGMKFGARMIFQLLHTDDCVQFDENGKVKS